METFYPFLACLGCLAHWRLPQSFALGYRIMNDPNSSKPPVKCVDDWMARLVMVDDCTPPLIWHPGDITDNMRWFPKAASLDDTVKLYQRIIFSDNHLPILTAITFTILSEIYSTTSNDDRSFRRVRLKHRSSPIGDFGIAKGTAATEYEDLLAFYGKSDGIVTRGQDPKEHYWLWFKTVKDQEVVLDLSMYAFNFCTRVFTRGHVPADMAHDYPLAPAFFYDKDKETRKHAPNEPISRHFDREDCTRVSALNAQDLENAVQHSFLRDIDDAEGKECIGSFMARVAGREIEDWEKTRAHFLSHIFGMHMKQYLQSRIWQTSPPSPRYMVEPPEAHPTLNDRAAASWVRSCNESQRSNRSRGPQLGEDLEDLIMLADIFNDGLSL